MKWMTVCMRSLKSLRKKPQHSYDSTEMDDSGLARRMRTEAVRLHADGRGTLMLPNSVWKEMNEIARQAERLHRKCSERFAALEILLRDLKQMQNCAQQAKTERAADLPATEECTRIENVIRLLCGGGQVKLTRERLMLALASFDDVQPLEMAEIWAAPEALRVCLSRAYVRAAKEVLQITEERRAAEAWAERPEEVSVRSSPVFFEHALRLIIQREEHERRAELEQACKAAGFTLEQAVQLAHGRESLVQMQLENLMAGKRMIDSLDWQTCFSELSAVERELDYDPSGIYSRMEEDSKAAVRRELAMLARRMNLSELTLARHGVSLARMAVEENDEPARQSVCFWLYEDEGRKTLASRVGAADAILPKMTQDRSGRRSVLWIMGLFLLCLVVCFSVTRSIWFVVMGIPLAWGSAMALVERFFPFFVKPAKLLKMKVERVEEEQRTLVVMPVLLSSVKRAEEICDHFEALGCLEKDENIRYLLLGDFSDADRAELPDDAEIVDHVNKRMEKMNERLGRKLFFYLHRGRSYLEADRKWMGRDRKRGALMDLNRLLLGKPGAETAFTVENRSCAALANRFRYVLTLDADTQFLPGTVQRLIGTISHPLNRMRMDHGVRRGYAVLQPQMEMTAHACVNSFVRLFSGNGGINSYPASVSGYWQDVTGNGLYGGKGLYDVQAFAEALEGALPEGRILSHDLIEGTLAGAAQVSDVCLYDGFPATMAGFLKRLNRWMRGDWQLLPLLVDGRKYPQDQRRLTAVERLRLADNLLRSLWTPALLGILILSIWTGNSGAFGLGMVLAFRGPILYGFGMDRMQWRRALAELAMLPGYAGCTLDAILRTVWRLAVSKKHLLDWVTSADAEKEAKASGLPGRIAAFLLFPGLFIPGWQPAALALGLLFWVGPGWIRDMEKSEQDKKLSGEDEALLRTLAQETWNFFAMYVNAQTNNLPPDNVQVDPDVGAAPRTSPTNIGLYLMSCAAARRLGLIDESEMLMRMEETVDTLCRMEKWNGHFYNWYDIHTLEPLRPKYVSSVDSGNLAAALLLCASEVETYEILSEKLRGLAKGMDLAALYDPERKLFYIGMDAERGRLSESHYDLLASESRILSYTAIMLGQAPVKHWNALGRAGVRTKDGMSLASWSGTMFEYLMPELFMHAPENTLLGQTMKTVVSLQKRYGERMKRPWGISESGYCAFDLHLNYQYRAFGLNEISLGGEGLQDVTAPYASVMASMVEPGAAAANIREMTGLGWRDDCGFFEAADYLHTPWQGKPKLVKSYMAHHQGMSLCSLCNVLEDGAIRKAFERIPEARAISLLLEEKPLRQGRVSGCDEDHRLGRTETTGKYVRTAHPERRLVDAHLLGGGGATAFLTAEGMVHYQRFGIQATRFGGDLLNRSDGACVYIRRERTGECAVIRENTQYFPGGASMTAELKGIKAEMQVCVSPEDGTLFKKIVVKNTSDSTETLRVADCAPVSMGTPAQMRAHPVFRHLFVESSRPKKGALMFRCKPREEGERTPVLMHMVNSPGQISCETDYEKLVGRTGSTMQPGGIEWKMSETAGSVLNPCSAIQTVLTIAPGQRAELHFAMALVEEKEAVGWMERSFSDSAPERAMQLATMQAQAMLDFIGIKPAQAHDLHRLSAILMDSHLSAAEEEHFGEAEGCKRAQLWPMGISGDLPILLMHAAEQAQMTAVKDAIRAHAFYRMMGLETDLVLVNEQCGGYDQPLRDAISAAVACSHLGEMHGKAGGVHLLEGSRLSDDQREALHRMAALEADGSVSFDASVRKALQMLNLPKHQVKEMQLGGNRLPPMKAQGNGFGMFLPDGRYAVNVICEKPTPAPWANLMANDEFGILLTERGGGFIWSGSSRTGRLTAFANDVLSEGWGWMLYLVNEKTSEFVRLLPGKQPAVPFHAIYSPGETIYRFETDQLSGETALCVRTDASEMRIHVTVRSAVSGEYRLVGFVDWLMGEDAVDAAVVRTWSRDGAGFAVGASEEVGYFAAANARVYTGCSRNRFLGRGTIQHPEGIGECSERSGGWVLNVPVLLKEDVPSRMEWMIGTAQTTQQAYARVRAFYAKPEYEPVRMRALDEWKRRQERLTIETPDEAINQLANGWLLHQTLTARIRARTGLYQPGGAYGFRDQLQDMLALLPFEPQRVREHILRCAAHQFEDGDVMHWWHEPFLGVRTRISDDMLFLPYVTAKYIQWTQDEGILDEQIFYLENVRIEPGKDDVYCEMKPGMRKESLHEHCMRAFRRAAVTGEHGLVKMGSGDWNDGMNRIGHHGRGESVWLTEFLAVCAEEYAPHVVDPVDSEWLLSLSEWLKASLEEDGWDGSWYLRAYTDDGFPIGSAQNQTCRIDVISQDWAVLAGLNRARCEQAMESAWDMLADEEAGIIRLLTPPFDNCEIDPGYIAAYPKGVRENGAQYTHGACWLLLALIRMGDDSRAHRALQMLLPASHADTPEKARRYRVEPYVTAADVYDGEHASRGGWTWYTGSAAWLYVCILELLGFERRGSRVRLRAMLGDWPEAAVTVMHGESKYRLVCRKGENKALLDGQEFSGEWIELIDDGCDHEAVFPPRIIP